MLFPPAQGHSGPVVQRTRQQRMGYLRFGHLRRGALLGGATAALMLVAGCATSSEVAPSASGTRSAAASLAGSAVPHPDHVMIVVFENKDEADVLGLAVAAGESSEE